MPTLAVTNAGASFIPSSLQSAVATEGVNGVFEDLLSDTPPEWFGPVIQEMGRTHYSELGYDGPVNIDPSSDIAQNIWKTFKSSQDIGVFLQEMSKKFTGSSTSLTGGGSGSSGNTNYGAFGFTMGLSFIGPKIFYCTRY